MPSFSNADKNPAQHADKSALRSKPDAPSNTLGAENTSNQSASPNHDPSALTAPPTGNALSRAVNQLGLNKIFVGPRQLSCGNCMRMPGSLGALQAYGGKHQGLINLQYLLRGTGVDVPPFIGVSVDSLPSDYLIKQGTPVEKTVSKFVTRVLTQDADATFMARSSSAKEDKAGQANAGCFESVANVPGRLDALAHAVRQVAESFQSARAQTQMRLYESDSLTPSAEATRKSKRAESSRSSIDKVGDGVVIQEMIGEKPGKHDTVTAAGVGLTPDSRSRAPDTFNLVSSWGHGMGVVDGTVVSDETLGVITPDTQSIHARTRVMNKPERVGPRDGIQELDHLPNEALAKRPALSQAQIQRYAEVLLRLRDRHATGADMEFVSQKDQDYLVQQRAQDEPKLAAKPTFISQAFKEAHADNYFSVDVISYRQYGVLTIDSEHRLVADSLNDAFFKDYLNLVEQAAQGGAPAPNIKAVFVPPLPNANANANSHAAAMLRREGVAIVEVADQHLLARLSDSETLVLDEQRGGVIFKTLPETDDIQPGRLQYPAPATYSIPAEASTKFDAHNSDPSARPKALGDLLSSLPLQASERLNVSDALRKLKRDVAQAKSLTLDDLADSMAPLLRTAYGALKVAKQNAHPMLTRVSQELTLDLLRLAHAVENNFDRMDQLLYVNWIEAALTQLPHMHPDQVNVFSLRSELQAIRTERAFVQWFWSDCEEKPLSYRESPKESDIESNKDESLQQPNVAREQTIQPSSRSWPALKALKHLHQLSYAISNPALKQQWLQNIATFARDGLVSDTDLMQLRSRVLMHQKAGTFEAVLRDLKLTQSEGDTNGTVLPLAKLLTDEWRVQPHAQQLTALNDELRRMTDTWLEGGKRFDDNLSCVSAFMDDAHKALDALNADRPNQAIALTIQLDNALEQMDHSIKKIIAAPNLSFRDRAEKVRKLLGLFHQFSMPIINKAYGAETDAKTQKRMTQLRLQSSSILRTSSDVDISVMRGRRFNVCYALISAAADREMVPYSLGDLHTLLHQNARNALGKINADHDAVRCLPSMSQSIAQSFAQKLATHDQLNIVSAEQGPGAFSSPVLMGVDKTEDGYESHYAIPLRTHGFRLIVTEHDNSDQLDIRIGLDGTNENKRFNIAQALFMESWGRRLGLENSTIAQRDWPNQESAPPFICGWSHRDGRKSGKEPIDSIVDVTANLIASSYRYSFGTFDRSPALRSDYALYTSVEPTFYQFRDQGEFGACSDLLLEAKKTNKYLDLGDHVTEDHIIDLLAETEGSEHLSSLSIYDFFRLLQAKTSQNDLERVLAETDPEQLFEIPHANFKALDFAAQRLTQPQLESVQAWVRENLNQFKAISAVPYWGKHSRLSTSLAQLARFQGLPQLDDNARSQLVRMISNLSLEGAQALSSWLLEYPRAEHFDRLAKSIPALSTLDACDSKDPSADDPTRLVHNFAVLLSNDVARSLERVEALAAMGECKQPVKLNMLRVLTQGPESLRTAMLKVIPQHSPETWDAAGGVVKALTQIKAPISENFATFLINNLDALNKIGSAMRVRSVTRLAASSGASPVVLSGTYDAQALLRIPHNEWLPEASNKL